MLTRKAVLTSSWLVIAIASGALCGCAKPSARPAAEQPVAPQASDPVSQPPQPNQMPEPPPAKLQEVEEAVKRVFKNSVVIDPNHNPSFLVGDFNGDLSQDLAVVLKPAEGKLLELNQEFPNWIAREPIKDALLPKSKALAQPVARSSSNPAAGQTIRFEQSDVLLAIVHGSGPQGWRDSEATQTHLLRDVVGANIRTMPFKAAVNAYNGIKPFPTIQGDLIQQTLIGQSGFLHFTGGIYAWYDPRNYKAVPVPAHSGMSGTR